MVPSREILGAPAPSMKNVGFSSHPTRQKLVSYGTWVQLDHSLVLVQKKTATFSLKLHTVETFFLLPKRLHIMCLSNFQQRTI